MAAVGTGFELLVTSYLSIQDAHGNWFYPFFTTGDCQIDPRYPFTERNPLKPV
jgi:hypothetical protein